MQNFTLGKRGIPMLLFALILLTTSFSSFGQENCPTVSDTSPEDFCYLQTIQDLTTVTGATVNTGTVAWYRTAVSPNPIPENELLQSGSYYAGNGSGNCTERVEVNVFVDDIGAPEPSFGNIFSPCVYGPEPADGEEEEDYLQRVSDLIANIEGADVQIFAGEFDESPLDENELLVRGNNYFAGQRSSDECTTSSRVAIRYDPIYTPAPTADDQTFCEGATVADLEAEATSANNRGFRWYSTADSQPALASSTPLIDGETYYVSQIVNRIGRDQPPCESEDRAEVVVTINPPVDLGTPTEGIICNSNVQETFPSVDAISNYYLGLLPEGTPTDGTFNPTPAELAQLYQNDTDGLGSFTTVYTVGVEGCESSVELTATIVADEEANAGTIEPFTIDCDSQELIDLTTLPNEEGNTGGTFTGEGVDADGNFNPSVGPGTYEITYRVDDSADCVIEGTSDETTFTITVEGIEELGEPIVMEMCITEVLALLDDSAQALNFFNNILEEKGINPDELDGEFSQNAGQVAAAIFAYVSNPEEPSFVADTVTYTVDSECGEESVDINLIINNLEAPEAGPINPAPVCASETPFDLYSLLGDNNDAGGTFLDEDENEIDGSSFDVSVAGDYVLTYTVTASAENCTAGDDDETTFTLTVNEGNVAESPAADIVCESDVQTLFPSVDEIRKYYIAIAQRAGFPTNGTISPTGTQLAAIYQADEDGLGDFTTTYTFGEGDCQTSVDLTVTINPAEDADAGTIENITVDCNNEDLIDLASLPNSGGNTGGTFSGEGVTNNNFDPSIGPGSYEITYLVDDSADCVIEGTSDETTFIITVQGTDELPDAIPMEMCITEVQALLADPTQAEAFLNNLLTENGITNLEGDFDETAANVGLEILGYINSNPTSPGTFGPITYTIISDCGEESVDITLTINNTEEPNAGEINPAPVCASATPFDLFSLLGEDNDPNGTFSDEDGEIEDGLFNVSQTGTYDITYTVTESDENCTAGEPDSTEFILTVNEGIVAESPEAAIVCESDVQETFPSNDEIRKFYIAIAQGAGFPTNGTLSPTASQLAAQYQADEDGLGDFTTTYTFGEGDCQTSVELTVTIVPAEEATVNQIEDSEVCTEEDTFDLFSLTEGNTPGGTFFDADENEIPNGMLDVSARGEYTVSYTVTESDTETCLTGTASTTFTLTVNEGSANAGDNIEIALCSSQVENFIANPAEAAEFFSNIIDEDVDQTGTFDPSLESIAAQWAMDPVGSFTTTYTVGEEPCQDSAEITIVVTEGDANAGEDGTVTLNEDDDAVNLFDYLGGNPDEGGTWSSGNGTFDPATDAAGVYTYTVGTEPCQDTATVTVTVTTETDPTDPTDPCEVGTATLRTICAADVQALFSSVDEIRKYYLSLLDAGVATTGTFNPTAAQLATQYQNDADGLGDFSTTYTLTGEDCSASVSLTVRIVEDVDAGTNGTVTLNEDDDAVNLFDYLGGNPTEGGTWSSGNGMFNPATDSAGIYTYTVGSESCEDTATVTVTVTTDPTDPTECEDVVDAGADNSVEVCNSDVRSLTDNGVRNLFLGLLEADVSRDGTFEPSISELINQYNIVSNYGDFTTTYTVVEGDCSDSAVLTVTVLDANDAGEDMDLTFCSTEEGVNLFDYLSSFATQNGNFEGYEDGIFDPATADLGETIITYEVPEDDSVCSNNNFTATFTITVNEPQDANAGGNVEVTYCIDQDEHIELSSLLGEGALNIGSFSAPFEDGVFNPSVAGEGEYVITYSIVESDCAIGTDTATITINVGGTASEAPVADAEQFFCLVDDSTVADLVATGEGELTWYTDAELTTPAASTDVLQDGDVYYVVSSTGDSACEISEPVMVTVSINDSESPTISTDGNEFCRQDNPTVQELINNLSGTGIQIYSSATGGTALSSTTELENDVTYYATATDPEFGCESSERRAITVEVEFCGIPEGFSPNDDQINDRFVIEDIAEDYPNYTIEIFNRWGNAVFKGNANTPDWDGVSNQSSTLGDDVLPAGVYFYIVNYNDGSTPPAQGKLYLSR